MSLILQNGLGLIKNGGFKVRKFHWYELGEQYISIEATDDEAIKDCIDQEIEMTIDNSNRIYNEGGIYIADVTERGKNEK